MRDGHWLVVVDDAWWCSYCAGSGFAVECPTCEAEISEPCKGEGYHYGKFHPERRSPH